MEILPYIAPFAWLVLIESLMIRWISGGPVPGVVSRVVAVNVAGIVMVLFVSLMGWFNGWWPDIRNWALRDSFFVFLVLKAPVFGFLFRRWGMQRIFTLHVLSNFTSAIILSVMFIYAPEAMAIRPLTVDDLNRTADRRLGEIKEALERYYLVHSYYPRYIWGGDIKSWGSGPPPDPLLAEGLLDAYPVNALNLRKTYFEPRRVPGLKALWFGDKSIDFLHVRNLWWPIVETDPRFGYRGTKMGNVLPDPRYPETRLLRGDPSDSDTWERSDIRMNVQGRWLPGAFFYRSYDLNEDGKADAYIMGVFGDENKQATIDCYDARVDRLTTMIGSYIHLGAQDGKRDGVIYWEKRGFARRPGAPGLSPETTRTVDPETGELI
ncbi:MAG TPA: hypothetical protein ENN67_05130, partial [Firmicutes bacterium]|nr:hypothetical protein [Bacillota bacterium]